MSDCCYDIESSSSHIRESLDFKVQYFHFLFHKFSQCQTKGKYSDVKLKIGSKIFNCHRIVLASNSKYFASCFKNDFKESEENIKSLPGEYVDERSFFKLLNAMYGGDFEIENDLIPLFVTSEYLQLTYFTERCKDYIRNNLEVIDTIELITLPQLKFDKSLYILVKKFVCRNFSKLYSRMKVVSLEVFEEVLLDLELFVVNKDHILDFGKNWVSYDLANRKQHLPKISSLLKPHHVPSDLSLELLANMDNHLQNDFDVKVALNALLAPRDPQNEVAEYEVDLPDSLFFVRSNNDSELHFATYRDSSWLSLDEFQLPVTSKILVGIQGAVANNVLYFSAKCMKPEVESVIFYGCNWETREWIKYTSPHITPKYLTTCNSKIYSYDHSFNDYLISFFEPFLNRWLKAPSVKTPRKYAGIASNGTVLYMVGGYPRIKIDTQVPPSNVIEMYDDRCGNWSRIAVSNEYKIGHESYHKRVCCLDNMIYFFTCKSASKPSLSCIDVRNNKWLSKPHNYECTDETNAGYAVVVRRMLWFISKNPSDPVTVYDSNCSNTTVSLLNPNSFVKPIALPHQGQFGFY